MSENNSETTNNNSSGAGEFLTEVIAEYKRRQKAKHPEKQETVESITTKEIKTTNVESQKFSGSAEEIILQGQTNFQKGIGEERRPIFEFQESRDIYALGKNISAGPILKVKETLILENSIFTDQDSNVEIIGRKLNRSVGEYTMREISVGDYDRRAADKILLSSYLGTLNTKGKSLSEIYYIIKSTVKEFYTKNEIEDIDNSIIKASYYILKALTYKKITPLFFDPLIEDINGVENNNMVVYYAGKISAGIETNMAGDYVTNINITTDEIDEIIRLLIERGNDTITKQMRVKSVTLPTADAARFTAIYPYQYGGNMAFSVRKQVFTLIPPNVLIKNKNCTVDALAYIAWIMDHTETGKIAVVGLPAAGKTTFLKTATLFIPYNARVFTIETTPELQLTQRSWTRQVEVTEVKQQTSLINASLMFRPDYVIIGEVKEDKELADALFSIIASGEKSMFTFHASSPSTFLARFQARAVEITKDRLSNMAYMLFLVLDPTTHIRYLASIDEIFGYDDSTDSVLWKNLTSMHIRNKESQGKSKNENITVIYDTKFGQAGKKYISYDLYESFVKRAELNVEAGQNDRIFPDQLLLMILNSELLKQYVYIHNIDLELTEIYNKDGTLNFQLTYWKTYKKLFEEISLIRNFLITETVNDVDVSQFLIDYKLFYNDKTIPEIKK